MLHTYPCPEISIPDPTCSITVLHTSQRLPITYNATSIQDGLLSCPSLQKLQQYPSEDSEFWCKIKLVVVQQLENNQNPSLSLKYSPCINLNLQNWFWCRGIGTLERILKQERTLLERQNLQDIQQAWIPSSGCDDDVSMGP